MCLREILTPKQWRIAKLVADGEKNATIGKMVGRTEFGVKHSLCGIYDLAGVWSRLQLSLAVVRHEFCPHCYPDLGVERRQNTVAPKPVAADRVYGSVQDVRASASERRHIY